jgi:hypothetical protein
MVPIWSQFHQVLLCSENSGMPDYAYAMVIVESILFSAFGVLQLTSVIYKLNYIRKWRDSSYNVIDVPLQTLFIFDCAHAVLSLAAKTMLVWILLAPALSVDHSMLTDRL